MKTDYLYNNLILDASLQLSPSSPLLQAGCGLFETVLYRQGRLWFWEEHLNRLQNSLTVFHAEVKIGLLDRQRVESWLAGQGWTGDCRVKLTAFPSTETGWDWLLSCREYQRPSGDFTLQILSETADYPLLKHKTLNYWPNLISLNERPANVETARLNSRHNINEGCRTNLLLIKDNVLYYVDQDNNYLPGIIQQKILDNYRETGLKSIQSSAWGFSPFDLEQADQIILTNSLLLTAGVSFVRRSGVSFSKKIDYSLQERLHICLDRQVQTNPLF